MSATPHVWTCGPRLLTVLAEKVLHGFPVEGSTTSLAQWTILVPTRRARRALENKLFHLSGKNGLVLPVIRPIGDVAGDDDDEHDSGTLSKAGQIFLLLQLIDQWADENPQLTLARDISASPAQGFGLATSLSELFDKLETEEVELELGGEFFGLDLAGHREAITSLLALIKERLPQLMIAQALQSRARQRNAEIRKEAARIAEGKFAGPVIAAGSTGSNPATRALLKAIAQHSEGAVILPGLDKNLDDEAWNIAGPEHPQYVMKLLLADLGLGRSDVRDFDGGPTARLQLVSEVMRPAVTTEKWRGRLQAASWTVAEACAGLTLMEAPDRHLEARAIAVAFRELLEQRGRTAALVTPDRDLAARVAAELGRWGVVIDDSAGRPLADTGRALLLINLVDCLTEDFSPQSLASLLAHPAVTLGLEPEVARKLARQFECAFLRTDLPLGNPSGFASGSAKLREVIRTNAHAHPLLRAMEDADWLALESFTLRFAAALRPLCENRARPFGDHIATVETALASLAGEPAANDNDQRLIDVLEALRRDGAKHPRGNLRRALVALTWALRQEKTRPIAYDNPRLTIYGLPEARMMEADLVVLGGLNETIWPPTTDPGPWVNRSMAAKLKLQAPERDIGITAHDFAQGLGHPNVIVTWSKRIGTEPRIAARWVLRLRTLLEILGQDPKTHLDARLLQLAKALDQPRQFNPVAMPCPRPALHLRPTRLSVSDIRSLQRDPYALYARKILKLEPLPKLGGDADPRLRGQLFHDCIGRWLEARVLTPEALLAEGKTVFGDFLVLPAVAQFWWPRFKRMALALAEMETTNRSLVAETFVERSGKIALDVNGVEHFLTARADRIDILRDGSLRIIDYKTGVPPSAKEVKAGLEPQLTLEALIAQCGGFAPDMPQVTSALHYVRISGLTPPVKEAEALAPGDIAATVTQHAARLVSLLAEYRDSEKGYLPRRALQKENELSDFDHLSRYREWSMGGA